MKLFTGIFPRVNRTGQFVIRGLTVTISLFLTAEGKISLAADPPGAGRGPLNLPTNVSDLARAFRSADPTNRVREATILLRALPKCPVTERRATTTGAMIAYDYSSPSYILTSRDVESLLGTPLIVATNTFSKTLSYLAGASLGSASNILSIELRDDHVVKSWIAGAGRHVLITPITAPSQTNATAADQKSGTH